MLTFKLLNMLMPLLDDLSTSNDNSWLLSITYNAVSELSISPLPLPLSAITHVPFCNIRIYTLHSVLFPDTHICFSCSSAVTYYPCSSLVLLLWFSSPSSPSSCLKGSWEQWSLSSCVVQNASLTLEGLFGCKCNPWLTCSFLRVL